MVARSKKEEIPQKFGSIEAAGAFWDTHSLADFAHETREVPMTFELSKRVRYISVPEAVYQKISNRAHQQKRTVRDLVLALGN
jgi:alpha-galactosidase/6-phospho-beta-glucosidase family protein